MINGPIIAWVNTDIDHAIFYYYAINGKDFYPWWERQKISVWIYYQMDMRDIKNHPFWEEDILLQVEEFKRMNK